MYTSFFGFQESPFTIAPNPRYLYMSDQHREALAHLQYGIKSTGGFVMLSGEVGAGKTTLCRSLLHQLPADTEIAFIFNPAQTAHELFQAICEELKIPLPDGPEPALKTLQGLIYQHLMRTHASGRSTLLIIDEAQSLPMPVLEQLRLLTNLETDEQKLLKIILLGQPELRDLIAHPSLQQLSQRITARFHLSPLKETDIQPYIQHRLSIAGGSGQLFGPQVCRAIYQLSSGIPRLINVLCDRALLGAYTRNEQHISLQTLNQAAEESLGIKAPEPARPAIGKRILIATASLSMVAIVVTLGIKFYPVAAPLLSSVTPADTTAVATPPAPVTPTAPVVPVTQPEQTAEVARGPSLQASTETATTSQDRFPSDAYNVLFSLWDLPGGTERNPCQLAQQRGLRCLSGTGSLYELSLLNRPAVIKLNSSDGHHNVVLSSLNDTEATIIENQLARTLPREQLNRLWDGNYTILWRPPEGYRSALRTGLSGPSISWLKEQLIVLTSAPLDTSNSSFDSELEFWVKAFQRSRGLYQDGVAGPKTLIHLNSVTSTSIPLLRDHQG